MDIVDYHRILTPLWYITPWLRLTGLYHMEEPSCCKCQGHVLPFSPRALTKGRCGDRAASDVHFCCFCVFRGPPWVEFRALRDPVVPAMCSQHLARTCLPLPPAKESQTIPKRVITELSPLPPNRTSKTHGASAPGRSGFRPSHFLSG